MSSQEFGGLWTEQKLDVVAAYLQAYTTALKRQRFRLTYVDAFAGSGWRRATRSTPAQDELNLGISGDSPGSALRALGVRPPFHRYVFNDRDPSKLRALAGC